MVNSFHTDEDEEETEFTPRFIPDTTIIHDYIGETDLEMTRREERRQTILRGATRVMRARRQGTEGVDAHQIMHAFG